MLDQKIIAVETSGRSGSVAAACGAQVLAERVFPTDREHARDLLPVLDELCHTLGWEPARLDCCCLSIGPGSFTGLRVAVTFARHLALAAGVKICAVPTLDAIVENCASAEGLPRHVAAVLDAKRSQVFGAVYERLDREVGTEHPVEQVEAGLYRRVVEPCLIEPAHLLSLAPSPLGVIGEGIDYHRAAIEACGVAILDRALWVPRAVHVLRIGLRLARRGQFTPARMLTPFYLRRPEAEEVWERRHGISPQT